MPEFQYLRTVLVLPLVVGIEEGTRVSEVPGYPVFAYTRNSYPGTWVPGTQVENLTPQIIRLSISITITITSISKTRKGANPKGSGPSESRDATSGRSQVSFKATTSHGPIDYPGTTTCKLRHRDLARYPGIRIGTPVPGGVWLPSTCVSRVV
eukprot:3596221-Rhodomonas_salina.1